MIIVSDSASNLKRFLRKSGLQGRAFEMVLRMVLAFILHRGRMSCSEASGIIGSEAVHRGELSRFLRTKSLRKSDWNQTLRRAMLEIALITAVGDEQSELYILLVDATLHSQASQSRENTFSTGTRTRKAGKGQRYNNKKIVPKHCHSFTFGLLLTPCGMRIPYQIPYYTEKYCEARGLTHRTTAEAAADMILALELPKNAQVLVLGDTAYDAKVVRDACAKRGFDWIFPANSGRVLAGPRGARPSLRSRLKDWTNWTLTTVRFHASLGKYAVYRRISKWRMGPKQKPREYYAYQEIRDVRSVGRVQVVFSTTKPKLRVATPKDVKILMTNMLDANLSEVVELYSLRWQIELFFKELKSTLGFSQYSFKWFDAVEAWVNSAITTVLFLEWQRATQMRKRSLTPETRRWWAMQRLHGLCTAFRQECQTQELKFLSKRLKNSRGVRKLQQIIAAALPPEYRVPA